MKTIVSTIALSVLLAFSAQAADKKGPPEPTAEQRQKMAAMHEKMAACLRTDKPISDCRKEMMDSCREMGKDCPMGYGHGPMGGHPMRMHDHDEAR